MKFLKKIITWFKRAREAPKAAPVAEDPPASREPPTKAVRPRSRPFVDPRVKDHLEEADLTPQARRAKPPTRKEAISMLARDAVWLRHRISPRPSSIDMHGRFTVMGRITRVSALFKYIDFPDGKFAAALDRKEEARLANLDRVLRRHFN